MAAPHASVLRKPLEHHKLVDEGVLKFDRASNWFLPLFSAEVTIGNFPLNLLNGYAQVYPWGLNLYIQHETALDVQVPFTRIRTISVAEQLHPNDPGYVFVKVDKQLSDHLYEFLLMSKYVKYKYKFDSDSSDVAISLITFEIRNSFKPIIESLIQLAKNGRNQIKFLQSETVDENLHDVGKVKATRTQQLGKLNRRVFPRDSSLFMAERAVEMRQEDSPVPETEMCSMDEETDVEIQCIESGYVQERSEHWRCAIAERAAQMHQEDSRVPETSMDEESAMEVECIESGFVQEMCYDEMYSMDEESRHADCFQRTELHEKSDDVVLVVEAANDFCFCAASAPSSLSASLSSQDVEMQSSESAAEEAERLRLEEEAQMEADAVNFVFSDAILDILSDSEEDEGNSSSNTPTPPITTSRKSSLVDAGDSGIESVGTTPQPSPQSSSWRTTSNHAGSKGASASSSTAPTPTPSDASWSVAQTLRTPARNDSAVEAIRAEGSPEISQSIPVAPNAGASVSLSQLENAVTVFRIAQQTCGVLANNSEEVHAVPPASCSSTAGIINGQSAPSFSGQTAKSLHSSADTNNTTPVSDEPVQLYAILDRLLEGQDSAMHKESIDAIKDILCKQVNDVSARNHAKVAEEVDLNHQIDYMVLVALVVTYFNTKPQTLASQPPHVAESSPPSHQC